MKKTIYSLMILLFIFKLAYNQNLPHKMTPEEQKMMPSYLSSFDGKGTITPPSSPVRTMAEWEEIDALIITWTSYQAILSEIVKYAQMECKVIINCSDSTSVKSYLTSHGVTPTNVDYVITQFNSVWVRDYGAQCAYKNDVDSMYMIDWVYNRPRPLDDAIPDVIAAKYNIPIFNTSTAPYKLINTGGNFMTDGLGNAFSSNLVLDENPTLTSAQVDTIVKKFMGLNRYTHMTDLPYDGIHHIDMHMKLLDEQTLLVGEYPSGVADGPQIEANLLYVLNNFQSAFGSYYDVVRIPMPPDNGFYPDTLGSDYLTYANGTFVNKTYLVPTYYEQYDTTALRILREHLPGYKVVGINCNSIIPASGAIHCITNCLGSHDPLLISHRPLQSLFLLKSIFQVDARIQHKSGIANAWVFYRSDTTQQFDSIPMVLTDSIKNTWSNSIPIGTMGFGTFQYYIKAKANSGKMQVRPITAPDGYWTFSFSLGIDENKELQKLTMHDAFPNPSKGITCIPIDSKLPTNGIIEFFDIQGRKIQTVFNGKFPAGKSNYFINTSDISAGTYIIRLQTSQVVLNQMLVIR